jgi:hypothetical protein
MLCDLRNWCRAFDRRSEFRYCYAIFGTGAEHLIADPNSDTGERRAHVNAACDFFRKRNPTLRWLGRHQPCASSPAATTRALPTAVAPLPPCRAVEPRRPCHRIKASPPWPLCPRNQPACPGHLSSGPRLAEIKDMYDLPVASSVRPHRCQN